MVTITKTKLIIELEPEYPPADILYDLQQSLLRGLQNQSDKLDPQQQKDVYACLLYLLEEMLYVRDEKKKK
jgi:hypothetical protein